MRVNCRQNPGAGFGGTSTVNVDPLLPYTTFTVYFVRKRTANHIFGRRSERSTVGIEESRMKKSFWIGLTIQNPPLSRFTFKTLFSAHQIDILKKNKKSVFDAIYE